MTGKGETRPTAFYMIAGQQAFLDIVRHVQARTTVEHVRKALFAVWAYDDPAEKRSLRWDPQDDARYATRWGNPSGDPARKRGGSVLGANRLAFEALALFPCTPAGARLGTTGFQVLDKLSSFTWPLWRFQAPVDVCRSLVALPALQEERPSREVLRAYGVAEFFRAEKVANSDYSNFSPSRSA